ncbi:hypothetical protein SCUP234_05013 [Seiridium cupressi]
MLSLEKDLLPMVWHQSKRRLNEHMARDSTLARSQTDNRKRRDEEKRNAENDQGRMIQNLGDTSGGASSSPKTIGSSYEHVFVYCMQTSSGASSRSGSAGTRYDRRPALAASVLDRTGTNDDGLGLRGSVRSFFGGPPD